MSESQTEKEQSEQATAKDRREFSRRKSLGTALIRPANQALASAVRVNVVDFSYGGACVIAPVRLNVGDHVLIDMPARASISWTVTFEAIVRWVEQEDANSGFRTGCAWIRQLSYHELQLLR
jgi:hypothetical protein